MHSTSNLCHTLVSLHFSCDLPGPSYNQIWWVLNFSATPASTFLTLPRKVSCGPVWHSWKVCSEVPALIYLYGSSQVPSWFCLSSLYCPGYFILLRLSRSYQQAFSIVRELDSQRPLVFKAMSNLCPASALSWVGWLMVNGCREVV